MTRPVHFLDARQPLAAEIAAVTGALKAIADMAENIRLGDAPPAHEVAAAFIAEAEARARLFNAAARLADHSALSLAVIGPDGAEAVLTHRAAVNAAAEMFDADPTTAAMSLIEPARPIPAPPLRRQSHLTIAFSRPE